MCGTSLGSLFPENTVSLLHLATGGTRQFWHPGGCPLRDKKTRFAFLDVQILKLSRFRFTGPISKEMAFFALCLNTEIPNSGSPKTCILPQVTFLRVNHGVYT